MTIIGTSSGNPAAFSVPPWESANRGSRIEEPAKPADHPRQWKCRSATLSTALP
jgi:hypothetical protein